MSFASSSDDKESEIEVIHAAELADISSGEDPPMSEWSSLAFLLTPKYVNEKRELYDKGLFSPGSGEVCVKYARQSNSSVYRHAYYNYPAVLDPGIKEALFSPEQPIIYPDNGQDLYLHLCSQMDLCPVRLFHRNLLKPIIDLSHYCVNPRGIYPMTAALEYNKFVTCFNLTGNFLDDDCCYHLGQMLRQNKTIKELNLTDCRIGASGILRLINFLYENSSLQTLNLAGNNIDDAGGKYYAEKVNQGVTVQKVNLSRNGLGRPTAIAFIETFEWKNPFTHLDLSWNRFFNIPSLAKMLEFLSESPCLQELNLSYNALEGERIAKSLQKILTDVKTLTALDISHNRFRGDTIILIASGLIKAKKLVTFNISANLVPGLDACTVLGFMLKRGVKLEKLYMDYIDVDKSFLHILTRVKRMKSRKNFVVTYGYVLQNWVINGPDNRDLILKRLDYLCKSARKKKVDIGLYFLGLAKEIGKPIPLKDLITRIDYDSVPIGEDALTELTHIFKGPKTKKTVTLDINSLCEYIQRIWPERQLPPTPPPEPVVELPPPPPPKTKQPKKK